MTFARFVALLAALLALAALVWLILADHSMEPPKEPSINAGPVRNLEASIPAIGPFETYEINQENPFIPYLDRVKQTQLAKDRQKPTTPATKPKPKPEAPVVPDTTLPKLDPGSTAFRIPVAVGIIDAKDTLVVIAKLPGGKEPVKMKPKDELDGWRLDSVEDGLVANFTEIATGVSYRLIVDSTQGEGDVAPPEKEAPAPAKGGKDAKGGKEGKDAKAGKDAVNPKAAKPADKTAKAADKPVKPSDKPIKKTPPGDKPPIIGKPRPMPVPPAE